MSENKMRGRMGRMLEELSQLAEHASLTGAYASGAAEAAGKYNQVLEWVRREEDVPEWFFSPLPPSADWGRIGVESRMLASFLSEGDDRKGRRRGEEGDPGMLVALAPFMNQEDLVRLVESRMDEDGFDDGILVALAPFVGSDLLGRIVRRKLDRQPRDAVAEQNPPDHRPAPQPPPPPPDKDRMNGMSQLMEALSGTSLTPEQRAEIAAHLMRIRG